MKWKIPHTPIESFYEMQAYESRFREGKIRGGKHGLAYIAISYAILARAWRASPKSSKLNLLGEPIEMEIPSIRDLLEESIEPLLNYLWGDWWTPENLMNWCKTQGMSDLNTKIELQGSRLYDPASEDRMPFDRDTLASAILACMFVGREDALKKICSWYDIRIPMEYHGGKIDELHQRCLLLIAAKLSGQHFQDHEEAIRTIRGRPLKMSSLLHELVQAVFDCNQQAYERLLPESLDIRYKKWEFINVIDHVALEESILVEIAGRAGLPCPNLTKKQREFLICESDIA